MIKNIYLKATKKTWKRRVLSYYMLQIHCNEISTVLVNTRQWNKIEHRKIDCNIHNVYMIKAIFLFSEKSDGLGNWTGKWAI